MSVGQRSAGPPIPRPATAPAAMRAAPRDSSPPTNAATDAAETVAEDDDSQPSSRSSSRLGTLLRTTPSWLVSAVFHMAVLFALALVTFSLPEEERQRVLVGETIEAGEEPIVEEVVIDIEPVEMEQVAMAAVAPAAVSIANLGAAAAPADFGDVGAVNVESTMGDIGALFGDEGEGFARNDAGLAAAEFFGVKAGGRKFVFLVDSSLSMKGGKFEAALQELSYAIRKLSQDQFFYVIFFDWNAERMLFPVDPRNPRVLSKQPEPRAVRATPENIRNLEAWMSTVELELKTDPYEAMQFAVEMLPDAIYLLTDGMFRGKTESYLAEHNVIESELDGRKPKIVIHTIGFWSDQGQELLQRISSNYGGTYRFVPPPPKRKKR
jgi:hypothetical protein